MANEITGTEVGEILVGTEDEDIINGLGGNDALFGLAGNDTLNPGDVTPDANGVAYELLVGGAGDDTLNAGPADPSHYIVTYHVDDGPSGVTVDLGAGTATDSFGNTDTLNGITFVIGTALNDSLTGGTGNDILAPGGGTDAIDGGAGNDRMAYYYIAQLASDAFGFTSGITVNHTADNAGTVLDPLGNTDTFANVEEFAGTRFADVFNGSSGDDFFIGGDGSDTFSGGLGFDTVDYSHEVIGGGLNGVSVDLAAGTATGAYGETDMLNSIETAIGTNIADTLAGDASDNRLVGNAGDDVISGGGGSDILEGGSDSDRLVLEGNRVEYAVSGTAADLTFVDSIANRDGTDTALNFEFVQFADQLVAVANVFDPIITTPALSAPENQTTAGTVLAFDPDGQSLSYAIVLPDGSNGAGADGGLFTINSTTGELSFVTAPNFEDPGDTGGDNVYDVTIEVSDSSGGTDTQAIAVTVTDANEAPSFLGDATPVDVSGFVLNPANGHYYRYVSGDLTFAGAEALAASYGGYLATITSQSEQDFIFQNVATSADGTTNFGWLGGSDREVEGVWKWIGGPEAGLVFWEGLAANQGGQAIGYANFGVTEPSESGPEDYLAFGTNRFPWSASPDQWIDFHEGDGSVGAFIEIGGAPPIEVAENTTAATTVAATDPDAGQTLTYAIIGGADAAQFTIDPTTGALSFVSEAPSATLATWTFDGSATDLSAHGRDLTYRRGELRCGPVRSSPQLGRCEDERGHSQR